MLIENFAELSAHELKKFADDIINKVNAEHLFAPDIELRLTDDGQDNIVPDEMTGDLDIYVEPTEDVLVGRGAYWTCDIDDENYDRGTPEDPDYFDTIMKDIKKAFPTKTVSIDGYSVTIEAYDWGDCDTGEVREVTSVEEDDDGIGSYEYWGEIGYDSRPFLAVEGIIDCPTSLYVSLIVTPEHAIPTVVNEEE